MSGNPPAAVERFVREHRVARLATVDEHGRPHVVPICYTYGGGRLYTPLDLKPKAVAPEGLRRVRNILGNPQVQVLIDDYDEDWSRLAFVQLRGTATLLHEGAEYGRALRLLRRKYPQYDALPLAGRPIIQIAVERVVVWGRLRSSGENVTPASRLGHGTANPMPPPSGGGEESTDRFSSGTGGRSPSPAR